MTFVYDPNQAPADAFVAACLSYVGTPYGEGTAALQRGPSGHDCIGLMWAASHDAHLPDLVDNSWTVPHCWDLFKARGDIEPGNLANAVRSDLLVLGAGGQLQHIGCYLGNGYMVSAVVPKVAVTKITTIITRSGAPMHLIGVLKTKLATVGGLAVPDRDFLWEQIKTLAVHDGVVLPAAPWEPAAPAPVEPTAPAEKTYIVQAGDNLSHIAFQHYGNTARWIDIYHANEAVIGPDPNLIHPGQILIIPD